MRPESRGYQFLERSSAHKIKLKMILIYFLRDVEIRKDSLSQWQCLGSAEKWTSHF
ncbi:hypothetical protein Lsai_0469 [Legionella sainthelensi]|uniref:Uncharacterized protein n=1 Tax=Legionella sainthelensi TaxID=28087 RepID=A0A0W0YSF7_9GAMM|nr:hypothetical protein [Legionella sainthelensi]KTD59825.1 hypothetical protein Lsai_0469 [Legionella sainthelensi]VEH31330.1 Uncharacterised protein [Legionella sainthelensi]